MLKHATQLVLAAGSYRLRIENLCRVKAQEGYRPWRPNALGYVLVQIKERIGAVENLELPVVLELVQLLEVAQGIQGAHGDSKRVREIVRIVSDSYRNGGDLYHRMMRDGVLERDLYKLLNEAGSQIVSSVRWLQAHDKGGA